MRIEKTVEVGGRTLRVAVRLKRREGGKHVYTVRISEGHYFRDQTVVVDGPSADEAADLAVAGFLGTGRSSTMKTHEVKVAEAYLCKVGRNNVEVKVVSANGDGGWTVATATGKTLTIKDAARLSALPAATTEGAAQAAPGARKRGKTPKGATPTSGRKRAHDGAPQTQEKRMGLMGAAAKVLEEADQADLPMSCKKMVETAMAKGYWAPLNGGKTPVNTLAAMILRDLKEHGNDAKFRRAEERFGRGRYFLNH